MILNIFILVLGKKILEFLFYRSFFKDFFFYLFLFIGFYNICLIYEIFMLEYNM